VGVATKCETLVFLERHGLSEFWPIFDENKIYS
jgi:hypothetical protein